MSVLGSRRALLAIALAGAGVAVAPRLAAAQQQERLPERLSPATRDTIERLIDSARVAQLPTDPLVAKAAEGVLKGADDARILRAVRMLLRELADARAVLPAGASAATLSAGASALRAGVSPAALRRLGASRVDGSESELAYALITLADLVASSVPPDAAATSVELLYRQRTPEAAMAEFRAAVARDIREGREPEAAVSVRTKAVTRAGRPPGI